MIDQTLSSQEPFMNQEEDEVLIELRDAVDPIFSNIDADLAVERAAIVVGVKETIDDQGESSIQTMIDVVGDYGLLQEAMYEELLALINAGDPNLFQAMREVIHKIEEDLELEPNVPLTSLTESHTLH